MRSVGAVDDGPSAQRAVHKGPQGLRASVYCSYVLYVSGIGPKVSTDGDDPAARLNLVGWLLFNIDNCISAYSC